MTTVAIIGIGDLGERLAIGLATAGHVSRLVLASRSDAAAQVASLVTSISDVQAEPVALDATRTAEVARWLSRTRPDLIVQCAVGRSPWSMAGRRDLAATALGAAGFGLWLPYQLPPVLSVLRAAREIDRAAPVANLSLPDVTGPVLARLGLAPTLGLGNAAMILLRVRAALRAAAPAPAATQAAAGPAEASADPLPLIRILAQHSQLGAVMSSQPPADPAARCRVYLGETGERRDELAYQAAPLASGPRHNQVTAASALPVLHALLPGAPPLRWAAPAPAGLPGGYPVRIDGGAVTLDLPPGLSQADAVAFNEQHSRTDGIEAIDANGTVHFTAAAQAAVAGLDPALAAPLAIDDLPARAALLDRYLG